MTGGLRISLKVFWGVWSQSTAMVGRSVQLTTLFNLESVEGRKMAIHIISWSISRKVWYQAGKVLTTPGHYRQLYPALFTLKVQVTTAADDEFCDFFLGCLKIVRHIMWILCQQATHMKCQVPCCFCLASFFWDMWKQ